MAVEIDGLRLGRADHGRPLADDEFASAEFDEPWRYELEDGRLVVMSPNGEAHDAAAEPWREQLIVYKLAHPEVVQKVVPEAWVLVAPGRQRIGDLGVYLVGERSAQRRPARAPEIMIEVASPGAVDRRRDFVAKRADYHAIGVREYLIVDPIARQLTVLEHRPEGYDERVLSPEDVYATLLLPGLEIRLADVL